MIERSLRYEIQESVSYLSKKHEEMRLESSVNAGKRHGYCETSSPDEGADAALISTQLGFILLAYCWVESGSATEVPPETRSGVEK